MEASNSKEEYEAAHWKAKYEECEKTLLALKPLAADGVKAYDELLTKYNINQTEYKKLQEMLKEKEDQLGQVQNLLEPVYNEYDKLQTRLSIEEKCREEVVNYASKLTKENKVLRRQSQAFINKSGGLVPVEKEPDTFNEHCERMNLKIKELEEEMSELRLKSRQFEEDSVAQRERADKAVLQFQKTSRDLEHTKKVLQQHEHALLDLANCSEIAYNEYQSLKKKYDIEIKCRSKAEQYASKMYSQTEAMKRQSNILLTSVASDERLIKALTEVEEVNEELENLKQKHSDEVKSLQVELSESQNPDKVRSLEEELSRLEKENEKLQQKNEDFNTQYSELSEKYKKLEDKYETLTHPPPPPPPPLPVVFTKTKKNVTDIIKETRELKENKLKAGGVKLSDSYAKAIDEMMNRIKGGQSVLKPSQKNLRRPSAPEQDLDKTDSKGGQAMEELHNIFSKMKRNKSEGDLLSVTSTSPVTSPSSVKSTSPVTSTSSVKSTSSVTSKSSAGGKSSELAETFQKIRGSTPSNSGPEPLLPSVQEERISQISSL